MERGRLTDKRRGTVLALLLAALALVLTFVPKVALADETDSSSLDPFEYLTLDVAASTDGLPDDQVQVSVTGTNKVGMELADHTVSFKVPDGWTLVSGSTSSTPATTQDGESVSATAILAKNAGDGGTGSNANADAGSNAGSTSNASGSGAPGPPLARRPIPARAPPRSRSPRLRQSSPRQPSSRPRNCVSRRP